jgi:hypothetical protein
MTQDMSAGILAKCMAVDTSASILAKIMTLTMFADMSALCLKTGPRRNACTTVDGFYNLCGIASLKHMTGSKPFESQLANGKRHE